MNARNRHRLHGPVVVGELGHPAMTSFTAIGDTVNIAARVESATKGKGSLMVSEQVYTALSETGWTAHTMQLKGKSQPLTLYAPPPSKDSVSDTNGSKDSR